VGPLFTVGQKYTRLRLGQGPFLTGIVVKSRPLGVRIIRFLTKAVNQSIKIGDVWNLDVQIRYIQLQEIKTEKDLKFKLWLFGQLRRKCEPHRNPDDPQSVKNASDNNKGLIYIYEVTK